MAHDDQVFGAGGMQAVAAGGPGLVAVGFDSTDFEWEAAVWVSADGLAWSRVPHDAAVFGGPEDQRMVAVAGGGPGLVAVGYDDSGGDADAAVWVSADGLSWSRVADDEAVFGGPGSQRAYGVAVGGPGWVVVGYDSAAEGDGAVWVSADGLSWSRVADDEAALGGPGEQVMQGVAAGGPGLVAVGFDSVDFDRDAAVWVSADGLVWSRVAHDEVVLGGDGLQEMTAVAAGGLGLVAVGLATSDDDPEGDGLDGAMWVSADGVVWSRVAHDEVVFGGPDFQVITAVAAGGPGLVAVGHDFSGGDRDAAVWVSADGVVWSRVAHDEGVFGGVDAQVMHGVVGWGSRVVAVGEDSAGPPAAAVWVSPPPG